MRSSSCPRLRALAARHAVDHQRRGDVVDGVQLREQVVELIDEAELQAAHDRAVAIAHLQRVLAVEEHLACIGLFQQARPREATWICPNPKGR